MNPADLSSPECIRFAIVARGWYGSVEAKANIVRAVLSRELPVVGNADGTVAGLLVSYEGFQRLAHDERARANGDTRTIAEAARLLECNTRSIRRLVELEWLRAKPAPKAFRVTEESIAEFKKRYVSLLSIARTTKSASWALQSICKRCNLPMLVARQPTKKSSQAFIRAEQRQELLYLRSGRSLKSGLASACIGHDKENIVLPAAMHLSLDQSGRPSTYGRMTNSGLLPPLIP